MISDCFKKKSKKKKGNVAIDVIILIIVLFSFALAGIFINIFTTEMNTSIQNDTSISIEGKELMQTTTTGFPSLVNDLFLLIFIGLWIVMLITAWFTDTHPIFFIFTAILLVFVTLIGMNISNAYQEITADAGVVASADMFPNINLIMSNLGAIVLVIGFSVVMVLFGKSRYG